MYVPLHSWFWGLSKFTQSPDKDGLRRFSECDRISDEIVISATLLNNCSSDFHLISEHTPKNKAKCTKTVMKGSWHMRMTTCKVVPFHLLASMYSVQAIFIIVFSFMRVRVTCLDHWALATLIFMSMKWAFSLESKNKLCVHVQRFVMWICVKNQIQWNDKASPSCYRKSLTTCLNPTVTITIIKDYQLLCYVGTDNVYMHSHRLNSVAVILINTLQL